MNFSKIVKDENGEILELKCTADLETGNGMPADGVKALDARNFA